MSVAGNKQNWKQRFEKMKSNKWFMARWFFLSVILLVLSAGCAEQNPSAASSPAEESVAELQVKTSNISAELEKRESADADTEDGEHDHGDRQHDEMVMEDKPMKPMEDGMGMDMHGKDMKMKDMPMKSKDGGMGMHGKDMKMKDMPMKPKDGGMEMNGMDRKMKDMSMSAKDGGMGMGMMGMMHGDMKMMQMGDTAVPLSALPGFPGVSHIYHVGATGFFLDHADHLQLSSEQKSKLESLKAAAEGRQRELQEKIDEAEKEVWTLTGSDQPDIQKILEKVKVSEGLITDKRLGFIKAVGEAATVLTPEQRELLTSPQDKDETADSASHSH